MGYYIQGILIAVDILANAIAGGDHYTTISCRIGENIQADGWCAHVPWPNWLRQHFLDSVYQAVV